MVEHFFKKLNAIGKLNHQNHISGLDMWSFKMRDFYKVAVEMFIKDIYTYLEYNVCASDNLIITRFPRRFVKEYFAFCGKLSRGHPSLF